MTKFSKKSKRFLLTPKQQSEQTRLKREQIEQEHMWCPMEVRVKGPHTGLYCAQHGVWIKWISHSEATAIKDIL